MWYVIQARFAYDDEDDLYVRQADTEHEATAALEAGLREECGRPLCDECKAAVEGGVCQSEATETCGECHTFYVINTLECDTEPR